MHFPKDAGYAGIRTQSADSIFHVVNRYAQHIFYSSHESTLLLNICQNVTSSEM